MRDMGELAFSESEIGSSRKQSREESCGSEEASEGARREAAASESESEAALQKAMLRRAMERLRDHSPSPETKYLNYWLYRTLGKDDDFSWFASQLPTWPFNQEEAEKFLVEYAHLSGPILARMVEKGVLVQGNGGYYWMTNFGHSMRHLWAQMKGFEHEPADCARTFSWPHSSGTSLEPGERDVETEISDLLAADHGLDWEIRQDLRERQGVTMRCDDRGLVWHLRKILQDWCDGETSSLSVEVLHKALRRVPAEKLALLQRLRNGCPLMPELRALHSPKLPKATPTAPRRNVPRDKRGMGII